MFRIIYYLFAIYGLTVIAARFHSDCWDKFPVSECFEAKELTKDK